MSERTSSVVELKNDVKEPKMFSVIIHNDDYTPMDFVVELIVSVFKKSQEEAARIMMDVHLNGKSIAGVYSFDIATTKKMKAETIAKDNGFPLKITISEA